jgi:hypothetical protein
MHYSQERLSRVMMRQDSPMHGRFASALAAPTTAGNFGLELSERVFFSFIYTNTLRGTPTDQKQQSWYASLPPM